MEDQSIPFGRCFYNHNKHGDNRSEISSLAEDKSDVSSERDNAYVDAKVIASIEYKIDKINDILIEQHNLLATLKQDLANYNIENNNKSGPSKCITPSASLEPSDQVIKALDPPEETDETNNRAKTLLDAIELKHSQFLDLQIRDVLSQFLQSDGLKEHVTKATVESLKLVISNYFLETFPNAYLPILETSYRRLFRHVTQVLRNAFNELEENTNDLYRNMYRTSRTLRAALDKHQVLLDASGPPNHMLRNFQNAMNEVLNEEMKEWRHSLLEVLHRDCIDETASDGVSPMEPLFVPPSPPQPADPERSIIDQLMKSAEINKNIKQGNINKSFEDALSSADLSLVMAACRAADPTNVFAEPCALQQSVLLSLVQQLATDMVHDTQLKCRYLEDAMIHLNTTDPTTRAHLPTVMQDVLKHLSRFLQSYPSHVASRRIRLIIMAAQNMIN